jgi:hypothetical protein
MSWFRFTMVLATALVASSPLARARSGCPLRHPSLNAPLPVSNCSLPTVVLKRLAPLYAPIFTGTVTVPANDMGKLKVGDTRVMKGQANIVNDTDSTSPTTSALLVEESIGSGGDLPAGGHLFGSVIPSGSATASSIASLTGRFISPQDLGCVGNGTTDDTTCFQKAVNAAAANGWPLRLDAIHKYLISSTIVSSGMPAIIGSTPPQDIYATSCPAGIIVKNDIIAFSFTGQTGLVRHVCFQMAAHYNTRMSGAAIAIGATPTTPQGGFTLRGNTIIFPFNGIVVGGATTGSPTQTNGDVISDNEILQPSNIGISHGASSTNGSTGNTVIRDNVIYCAHPAGNAIGLAIYDGAAVMYYGGENGPYDCKYGTAIIPGASQLVLGNFMGVIGDSSGSNDLLIQPASSTGTAEYLNFTNAWVGGVTARDVPVLINAHGGAVRDIFFNGLVAHSGGNGSRRIIYVENGVNITITGSHIVADGGGTTAGPGVELGSRSAGVVVVGNFFGADNGRLVTSITLDSGTSQNVIAGNALITAKGVIDNSKDISTTILQPGTRMVVNGTVAVTCAARRPSRSFAVSNGLVTHC